MTAKILYDGKEAGELINVEENSPFKLECIGTGDPEPKVGWTVDVGPSRGDVPKGYKPVEIYNQFVIHGKWVSNWCMELPIYGHVGVQTP